jgi:hypothetical protein
VNALKESLPVDMRFAVTLLSTQILASAVAAETLSEKMVATLKEVCVAQTSSEAMMAAGEKTAAAENWKLLRSGPTPRPFVHNENGPKESFGSAWDLGAGASLYISILRPEQPGAKYDICLVKPALQVDGDDLTRAIDRQFGATLTKDTSGRFKNQQTWFFAKEKAQGNCGKQIIFSSSRGQPETLSFTDFAYPNDSQWDAIAKLTRCPNQ